MIMPILLLALSASAHAVPNTEQCVALYEQHRSPSRLDKCLGISRPISVEAQQLMDMCHILEVEATRRGFEIKNVQFVFKDKPGQCSYKP